MLKRFLLLLVVGVAQSSELFNLKFQPETTIKLGIGAETKSAEIEILQTRLALFEAQEKKFWETYQGKIDGIKALIKTEEINLYKAPTAQRDFLNKKLLNLRGIKQTVGTLKATWKEMCTTLKQHILYLEDYARDPHFNNLRLVEKKSLYTLVDLQQLVEAIAAEEEKVAGLITDKNQRQFDLEHRKKRLIALEKEYIVLGQKQKEFSTKSTATEQYTTTQLREMGELVDVQLEALVFERELADLRVQEEETVIGYKISQIEVEQKKLEVLRKKQDILTQVSLRIEDRDVTKAREIQESGKRSYLQLVESYSSDIEQLLEFKEAHYKQLRAFQEQHKQYGLGNVEWVDVPKNFDEFKSISTIGFLQEQTALCDRKIDMLHGKIDFEKIEYVRKEWDANIVESWYKIKHHLFQSNKELERELEKYNDIVKELGQEKLVFEDKRKAATVKLNLQNKYATNIQTFLKDVEKSKFRFHYDAADYQKIVNLIQGAQHSLSEQIDITGKLIESYSQNSAAISRIIQKARIMSQELQKFSLWHRSGRAISKAGVKNILPDLKMFLVDLQLLAQGYFQILTDKALLGKIIHSSLTLKTLLYLLFKLLLICGMLLFFHYMVPSIIVLLEGVTKEIRSTYVISLLCAFFLRFINDHSIGLVIWGICYSIFGYSIVLDFSSVVFFLASIFYFLYLVSHFVSKFHTYAIIHGYPFCSEGALYRLLTFLYWFLSVTFLIFFFREAFILATYKRSELPDILLAVYSGFVRILLLLLVRKEDIIGLLPLKSAWGIRIARFIEQYYYFLLLICIFIMVLMDPHIGGYNNLVQYIVWGITGSFLVVKGILFLYGFLRRSSAVIFFTDENDTLQERFPLARSSYALTIITLFISFMLMGIVAIAWIWGKPISFQAIVHFFTTERLVIGSGSSLQKMSLFKVLKTISFIPFAFLVGFTTDRFIINRLFSVLFVSPGVQNAISTISFYIVVIVTIVLGLWNEGLGYVVAFAIAPVLLSAVWAFREIMNDFVAYFVILIQRPVKVGDYIKLDDETCGVVRNITPRTVVLRRKRGFCIIIPNSRILRDTVTNWDYNLNYISCPDINLTIAFKEDPKVALDLIEKVIITVPSVLKSPGPILRLEEFSEMGYTLLIRVFIGPEKTLLQWDIASDVRIAIVKILRENNIRIAAPVRLIQESSSFVDLK